MIRVALVMCLHNQAALTRVCLDSLRATTEPFSVVVVDNGSTDETAELLRSWAHRFPLRVYRNAVNGPVIRAFNQGWRLAETEYVCLLHNDTELLEPSWLARMLDLADGDPSVGLVGLYGARRIRGDGRYAGRTLVHRLADAPTLRDGEQVEVAVVDGVCMLIRRWLLDTLGGFDEGYGFFHGYDRDLSFAVREAGWRCMVIGSTFVHRGGGTRAHVFATTDGRAVDLAARRAAIARFVAKYRHRLPCDVRSLPERMRDRVRPGAG